MLHHVSRVARSARSTRTSHAALAALILLAGWRAAPALASPAPPAAPAPPAESAPPAATAPPAAPPAAAARPAPPAAGGRAARRSPVVRPVSALRRTLAVGAAVVPGAALHGAGHVALGEHRTGLRLLAMQGVGLAGLAAGAVVLAVSGASDRLSVPSLWVTTAGGGLFVSAWLADIVGVAAGPEGTGEPVRLQPRWWLSQGYRHVRNPALAGGHLSRTQAELRLGAWSLATDVQGVVDAERWRVRTLLARRIYGATATRRGRDGSFVDAWLGYVHDRMPGVGVTESVGELAVRGRLDLRRLGPTLAGTFVEAAWGVGMGASRYDRFGSEYTNLVIAEARFGLYLGHDPAGWSEVSGYYSQRHDGFVGGSKIPGAGSGALGHIGAEARLALGRSWGLTLEVALGGARVFGVGFVYRSGGAR